MSSATRAKRPIRLGGRWALVLAATVTLLVTGILLSGTVWAGLPQERPHEVRSNPGGSLAPRTLQTPAMWLPLVLNRAMMAPERLSTRDRFGVAVFANRGALSEYPLERIPFGWYVNWSYGVTPELPPNTVYVNTLPVDEFYPPDWQAVRQAVLNNRGAMWMVGNEPECVYQGNRTPEQYAEIYHQYYTFLKSVDPTCRVAIGGVVQPTPLRLEWLDRVLAHYETLYGAKMPVDVWNIHNMILQEKRGDYGCDIPVGLSEDEGMLYPWWENDNMTYFTEQVVAFRRWMAEHGEQNKPLIISEYGIIYSSDWFDTLGELGGDERVKAFMQATFGYLLHATDAEIGYPADGNRLVQRWAWLSLNGPTFAEDPANGYNGNLCDGTARLLTTFGEHYEQLLQSYMAEE